MTATDAGGYCAVAARPLRDNSKITGSMAFIG
jgi:hypothetical protein